MGRKAKTVRDASWLLFSLLLLFFLHFLLFHVLLYLSFCRTSFFRTSVLAQSVLFLSQQLEISFVCSSYLVPGVRAISARMFALFAAPAEINAITCDQTTVTSSILDDLPPRTAMATSPLGF